MKNMLRILAVAVLFCMALGIPSACASTAVVVTGQNVTFVLASCDGTQPFTFQWLKDGQPIAGATGVALPTGVTGIANSAFILPAVVPTDAGIYSIKVSNPAGSTISSGDTLAFILAPSGAIQSIYVNGILRP